MFRARARAIGRELRCSLEHIVQERLPDDMLAILHAIDAKGERKH
jgi:hypothetical protein